jgi:hypothetical protein
MKNIDYMRQSLKLAHENMNLLYILKDTSEAINVGQVSHSVNYIRRHFLNVDVHYY